MYKYVYMKIMGAAVYFKAFSFFFFYFFLTSPPLNFLGSHHKWGGGYSRAVAPMRVHVYVCINLTKLLSVVKRILSLVGYLCLTDIHTYKHRYNNRVYKLYRVHYYMWAQVELK